MKLKLELDCYGALVIGRVLEQDESLRAKATGEIKFLATNAVIAEKILEKEKGEES